MPDDYHVLAYLSLTSNDFHTGLTFSFISYQVILWICPTSGCRGVTIPQITWYMNFRGSD